MSTWSNRSNHRNNPFHSEGLLFKVVLGTGEKVPYWARPVRPKPDGGAEPRGSIIRHTLDDIAAFLDDQPGTWATAVRSGARSSFNGQPQPLARKGTQGHPQGLLSSCRCPCGSYILAQICRSPLIQGVNFPKQASDELAAQGSTCPAATCQARLVDLRACLPAQAGICALARQNRLAWTSPTLMRTGFSPDKSCSAL